MFTGLGIFAAVVVVAVIAWRVLHRPRAGGSGGTKSGGRSVSK